MANGISNLTSLTGNVAFDTIISGLLTLIVCYIAIRIVKAAVGKAFGKATKLDVPVKNLITKAVTFVLWAVAIIIVAGAFGINATSLVALLSIAGLALSMSVQGLLGNFSRNVELWEEVTELVYVGFEPYLFMLYFELLTLETTDRFPGRAIYECGPRGQKVKALWNSMYHPTQENPYLNNAKSVYSLDMAWAETKLSRETQNGSLMLADIFDIMSELPYTTRRRVAHVIRCYLVHVANERQTSTPLPAITPAGIRSFVERVAAANSLTKGVLDQRLVDFLTMCTHDYDKWASRGIGSSVNETNASGRKFGDVEYLNLEDRRTMHAYEAHGGGLRDEYVQDHINSLVGTVEYFKSVAEDRGEDFEREVEIVYVAHDISRLEQFGNGYSRVINGIPFTFRFMTFYDLLDEAGGIDFVSKQTELFDELVHCRISKLPDGYTLKERYREITK